MIKIIESIDDLARQNWDVLVPTMGALHIGHESLIKLAKNKGDQVIVSIFVNPLQFESKSDLSNYPRTLAEDIKLAEAAGASAVFIPSEALIYPGDTQRIFAGQIGDLYEGVSRSNHFTGVLTVVKRLFDLVKPKAAVFGEKDFQQLYLIKQMVAQQEIPIEIIAAPIIREKNGLAVSSRNIRLRLEDRSASQVIYRALTKASIDEMKKEILSEPNFKLDYLELINEDNFEKAQPDSLNKRVIIAGWINDLRLIDNMPMGVKK